MPDFRCPSPYPVPLPCEGVVRPCGLSFVEAGANAFGNAAPRLSDARGFGIRKEDVAVRKNMRFTERLRMEFNVQVFNLLNRPQWGLANDNISSSDFGKLAAGYAV